MAYKFVFRAVTAALLMCAGCADDVGSGGGSVDPDDGANAYLGIYNPALRVQVSPANSGKVSVFPPPNGDGTYKYGTAVTVKAVPVGGYEFKDWSGASAGTVDSTKIIMNGSKTLTANFIKR
jgi:uncharacterized repeat protein (TIGR02543 family)